MNTVGWTIYNILLDFSGGTLSIIQFFMNCAILSLISIDWLSLDEWSGLKSNLVKLGLGSVSMFFDILFMIQHYILYPNHEEPQKDEFLIDDIERELSRSSSSTVIDISVIKTP